MRTRITMTREEAEAALQKALGYEEKHCEFSWKIHRDRSTDEHRLYEVEVMVEDPS